MMALFIGINHYHCGQIEHILGHSYTLMEGLGLFLMPLLLGVMVWRHTKPALKCAAKT